MMGFSLFASHRFNSLSSLFRRNLYSGFCARALAHHWQPPAFRAKSQQKFLCPAPDLHFYSCYQDITIRALQMKTYIRFLPCGYTAHHHVHAVHLSIHHAWLFSSVAVPINRCPGFILVEKYPHEPICRHFFPTNVRYDLKVSLETIISYL